MRPVLDQVSSFWHYSSRIELFGTDGGSGKLAGFLGIHGYGWYPCGWGMNAGLWARVTNVDRGGGDGEALSGIWRLPVGVEFPCTKRVAFGR